MANTNFEGQYEKRGIILCPLDGRVRPIWAMVNDLMRDYYDYEWGRPIHTESEYFERLCLEGLQAGLSWNLVLSKRNALRMAFHNFEVDAVAAMTATDIEQLIGHPSLIRNPTKLNALVNNARCAQRLREGEYGGLVELILSFTPPPRTNRLTSAEEIPTASKESTQLAEILKAAGFKYVGPTTCYALMQATGLVDDRIEGASLLIPPPNKIT